MATNGRLDISTLTKVDGWAYLTKNAAAAWEAGCAELVALGYPRPTITAPDGAYRTFTEQQYWKDYWTKRGLPQNAATPGTSGHGWATDADIWDVWKWPHAVLERVFGKYGFTFNVSWEAWHMHHDGTATASLDVTPIQIEIEKSEHTMKIIYNSQNNNDDTRRALVSDLYFEVIDADRSTLERKLWGDPVNVSQDEWTKLAGGVSGRQGGFVARIVREVADAIPEAAGGVTEESILTRLRAFWTSGK